MAENMHSGQDFDNMKLSERADVANSNSLLLFQSRSREIPIKLKKRVYRSSDGEK